MSNNQLDLSKSSALAQSERSERRANADDADQKIPSSRVATDIKKRRLDNSFKFKVLGDLESLPTGERGLYLRQNGLYASQVSAWRKNMKPNEVPKSVKDENAQLKKEIERLTKRNATLEGLIEIQKKMANLLEEAHKKE